MFYAHSLGGTTVDTGNVKCESRTDAEIAREPDQQTKFKLENDTEDTHLVLKFSYRQNMCNIL